ncbi:MAG: TonB-dependent receptor plug domain-containing protein [Urechidicola sp.]|nr:TonB-dependent receptor plug domain-containing protein [Urechidicola sp.]
MVFISDDENASLFYIDGKEVSKDDFKDLDPNTIKNVEVLKGNKAVEKYGDKAKGGVILVTTKKK